MTSSYNRRITDLPGLTINIYKGKPALNSDTKVQWTVHILGISVYA